MINDRNKTNLALENIFGELENMINGATRMPLMDKLLIEENELINLLDDLREAIPKEVKNADRVLEEQKQIVNKAYADAEMIVQQAKSEAERIVGAAQAKADEMVKQEEIVKQAEAVAEELKANALAYEEETKKSADEYAIRVKQDSLTYADDMLAYIGETMHSALQGLTDNRHNVKREMDVVSGLTQPEEDLLPPQE
ncbi:MAG: hypothetical protein Q4D21_05085 [Phascolarctobacterium sp.]|nr:hypothetical protein [Phascolarctobacterium sp.]